MCLQETVLGPSTSKISSISDESTADTAYKQSGNNDNLGAADTTHDKARSDVDQLLNAKNLLTVPYYTDSSELDTTHSEECKSQDSDSVFTSKAETMPETTDFPAPWGCRCMTPPKQWAWRAARTATQAAHGSMASTSGSQHPHSMTPQQFRARQQLQSMTPMPTAMTPRTRRRRPATGTTSSPAGADPLRRPPATIGSFANGHFPRRNTPLRDNFDFATDTILTNHYHDPGHRALCVLCEDAKLLLSAVTRKCPSQK